MEASSSRIQLLGVPIDAVTAQEAVECLQSMLSADKQSHVMTPNSEMLVEAARNKEFYSLFQRSALNLPDSVGLLKMAKRTKQHLPERITGVDTVQNFCNVLTGEHSVFLLGGAKGIAEKAAHTLQKKNPHLEIAGTFAGSPAEADAADIISRINASRADVLLVAYGAPQQDFWIDRHLSSIPTVKVAMGVGGTFDFLAGKVMRAPILLRSMGLEWLWRLILQPSRIKRIWNAVVVFPFMIFLHRND